MPNEQSALETFHSVQGVRIFVVDVLLYNDNAQIRSLMLTRGVRKIPNVLQICPRNSFRRAQVFRYAMLNIV